MIYDDADITCYARMKDKVYFIGPSDIMSAIQYKYGTRALQLILTPKNIKCLSADTKEAYPV